MVLVKPRTAALSGSGISAAARASRSRLALRVFLYASPQTWVPTKRVWVQGSRTLPGSEDPVGAMG